MPSPTPAAAQPQPVHLKEESCLAEAAKHERPGAVGGALADSDSVLQRAAAPARHPQASLSGSKEHAPPQKTMSKEDESSVSPSAQPLHSPVTQPTVQPLCSEPRPGEGRGSRTTSPSRPTNPDLSGADSSAAKQQLQVDATPEASFLSCQSAFEGRDAAPVGAPSAALGASGMTLAGGLELGPSGFSVLDATDSEAGTTKVWWRAPWEMGQMSGIEEELVKPSEVKASELAVSLQSPKDDGGGTSTLLAAKKSSSKNRLALRSPPTPVPVLLSTSATTVSPIQPTSESNIPKPFTPSPSPPVGQTAELQGPSGSVLSASKRIDSSSSITLPSTKLPKALGARSLAAAPAAELSKSKKIQEPDAPGAQKAVQKEDSGRFLSSSTRNWSNRRPANQTASASATSKSRLVVPVPDYQDSSLICEISTESILSMDSSVSHITKSLLNPASTQYSDTDYLEKVAKGSRFSAGGLASMTSCHKSEP
jgi:hypothetical protein